MFEKVSRVAEKTATSVSRRGFLGRVGKAAAFVAGALAGVTLTVNKAEAGTRLCSPSSPAFGCSNAPVGAACIADDGSVGKCASSPRTLDANGNQICNVCNSTGKGPRPKDPRQL